MPASSARTRPLNPLRRVVARLVATVTLLFGAACGDGGTPPAVVTISVTPSSATLEVGATTSLSATVTGASGASVAWSSSNPGVASVDPTGTVTGEGAGTATITAAVSGQSGIDATAAITVEEAPLSVEILGFEQDGQSVEPSALWGRVDAVVRYTAPIGFSGRIDILAGNTVLGSREIGGTALRSPEANWDPAPTSTTADGDFGQRPIDADLRLEEVIDIPLSVTRFDPENLTPVVPNDADTPLIPRITPAQGAGVTGATFTVRGNNPSLLVLDQLRGTGAMLDVAGTLWYNGDLAGRARLLDYSSSLSPLADLERIEVVRGPQTTLFGRNATAGVVTFQMPRTDPFAAGGVGDVEGSLQFGTTADIARIDGSRETVAVANMLVADGDFAFPDLVREVWLDNVAPQVVEGLFFTSPLWLRADLQDQISQSPGIRWIDDANGPATVTDDGVGGVNGTLSGGFTLNYELGQYFDGTSLGETAPALYVKADFSDGLGNTLAWPFLDDQGDFVLAGRDATAPGAPVFRVGASLTPNFAINPQGVAYAWDAQDLPGSGGVTSGIEEYRVQATWNRDGEIGCILGAFVDGACTEETLAAGTNEGWSPNLDVTGSFEATFDLSAGDRGLNFGPSARRQFIEDRQPPTLTGDAGFPSDLSGNVDILLPQAQDDLEVGIMSLFLEFLSTGQPPLSLLAEGVDVGTPFDGIWNTSAQPTLTIPWYRGIEMTAAGVPTGSFYAPVSVSTAVQDHGGNVAFGRTSVTNNVLPTSSFLTAGMDRAAFRSGPREICSAGTAAQNGCGGVPTQIDIVFEAFTSGQFEISNAQLWGILPGPPGQTSAARLTDVLDLVITDQGTFREAHAVFDFDASTTDLAPGLVQLFWLGWSPDGRAVMSDIADITVR